MRTINKQNNIMWSSIHVGVLYKTHMFCRYCSLDMSLGITPFKPWLSRPLHIQGVVLKTCRKKKDYELSLTNNFEILMHIGGSKDIAVKPLKYYDTTRTKKRNSLNY